MFVVHMLKQPRCTGDSLVLISDTQPHIMNVASQLERMSLVVNVKSRRIRAGSQAKRPSQRGAVASTTR